MKLHIVTSVLLLAIVAAPRRAAPGLGSAQQPSEPLAKPAPYVEDLRNWPPPKLFG